MNRGNSPISAIQPPRDLNALVIDDSSSDEIVVIIEEVQTGMATKKGLADKQANYLNNEYSSDSDTTVDSEEEPNYMENMQNNANQGNQVIRKTTTPTKVKKDAKSTHLEKEQVVEKDNIKSGDDLSSRNSCNFEWAPREFSGAQEKKLVKKERTWFASTMRILTCCFTDCVYANE